LALLPTVSAAAARDFPKVQLDNTEHRELSSKVSGHTYQVYVKLPRDYARSHKSYPVLYVTDAETNFGGISYIVQRLMKDELIPEIIVVGIAYGTDYQNFYKLRARDLTSRNDPRWKVSGKSEQFREFIQSELFPFIAKNYRVNSDRAYYGHSLGGLFGFHVLLTAPEMFDRYLLLSSSLWWADKGIFKDLSGESGSSSAARVYVATGGSESDHMKNENLAMVEGLEKVNGSKLKIRSEVLDGETHRTIFGSGFTRGLRYIYGGVAPVPAH
jgi:hypothetical protein